MDRDSDHVLGPEGNGINYFPLCHFHVPGGAVNFFKALFSACVFLPGGERRDLHQENSTEDIASFCLKNPQMSVRGTYDGQAGCGMKQELGS